MTLANTQVTSTSTPSQSNEDRESSERATEAESKCYLVWRKPWRVALGCFSFFILFWAYNVVIERYWILENFEKALPGLAKTDLRKFTMRSHMTFGALAVLCSFIQMTTPFTSGWNQNRSTLARVNLYRRIHRYSGRIYAMCAIMAFFFGQWFIFLKKFILVGGYNMGVSFSIAGFFIAYFAYMTWKTAPTKNGNGMYTIEVHRNYAIRGFSQIIAPVLYRFWYYLLQISKLYRIPYFYGGDEITGKKLICDDRDICQDYLRTFDVIYSWLYWISAWIVAEIIIAHLPRHHKQAITTTVSVSGDEIQIPLINTPDQNTGEENLNGDNDGSNNICHDIQMENASTRGISNDTEYDDIDRPIASVVNVFGCLLAVLGALGAFPIIYMLLISKAT